MSRLLVTGTIKIDTGQTFDTGRRRTVIGLHFRYKAVMNALLAPGFGSGLLPGNGRLLGSYLLLLRLLCRHFLRGRSLHGLDKTLGDHLSCLCAYLRGHLLLHGISSASTIVVRTRPTMFHTFIFRRPRRIADKTVLGPANIFG
ncbi:MAG: hypothetical protein KGJ11_04665 [Candidatus Omnitrophica bacterium]|nr:hypothetical protein [Candidatus Omnitrophota bacterium]